MSDSANNSKKNALASMAGLNKSTSLPQDFVGSAGGGECAIKVTPPLTINHSLNEILVFARQSKCSDIHLSTNNPIIFRQYSTLKKQTTDTLTQERLKKIIEEIVPAELMSEFQQYGDLEFVHTIPGAGRYRMTIMKHRFGWDLTARVIAMSIPKFEESGMPDSCKNLTSWAQGLVLITGPAGCGKSTSMSVLVEMINQNRHDHIISIENPVEIVYSPKNCQITQREINKHTLSQGNALRGALREDPDIIVVSELRDLESIQLAVTAAETGHLVLGTMNTLDAAQTITSLINSFPPEEQSIITNMISESLRGVISQQLIPKKDGEGMVAAFEVLIVNQAIANMIRMNKVGQINNAMATGKAAGMVLLDHSYQKLLTAGLITQEEINKRTLNPFKPAGAASG